MGAETYHGIPLSKEGGALDPMELDQLAPGVRGYVILADGILWVPLVIAEEEGSGAVGRFLDGLPPGLWRFPCVISDRLAGMLSRRGFALAPGNTWAKVVP